MDCPFVGLHQVRQRHSDHVQTINHKRTAFANQIPYLPAGYEFPAWAGGGYLIVEHVYLAAGFTGVSTIAGRVEIVIKF